MSACTVIASWLIGSRPHFIADTATPARVCVWMTQLIVRPRHVDRAVDHEAGLVHSHAERSSRLLPSQSTFTRDEAVISSNIRP